MQLLKELEIERATTHSEQPMPTAMTSTSLPSYVPALNRQQFPAVTSNVPYPRTLHSRPRVALHAPSRPETLSQPDHKVMHFPSEDVRIPIMPPPGNDEQSPSCTDHSGTRSFPPHHGDLYSTVAQSTKPNTVVKSVHINISAAPHKPVIICTMTPWHKVTYQNTGNKQVMNNKFSYETISVICCRDHVAQIKSQFNRNTVNFLDTLNSTLDTSSDEPNQVSPSVNPSSSISARKQKNTLDQYFKTAQTKGKLAASSDPQAQPLGAIPPRLATDVTNAPTAKPQMPSPRRVEPPTLPPSIVAYMKSVDPPRPPPHKQADHPSSPYVPSIVSWSDFMDEVEPINRFDKSAAKELSKENSVTFALDCVLLYSRAYHSRKPRTTLRGILDNTRPNSSVTGIGVKFGTTNIPMFTPGMHRHRLDHTETTPGTPPPYRNSDKRACTSKFCPLNKWAYLNDLHNDNYNMQLIMAFYNEIRNTISQSTVYTRDLEHAQQLQSLITEGNIPLLPEAQAIIMQVLHTQPSDAA